MPNIAAVLKAEISRVARKEIRSETEQLKKAVAGARSEISALKKEMREIARLFKATQRQPDGIDGKALCRQGCCHQGFGCGPPVWKLTTKKPPPFGWRDSEPQAFARGGYTGSATRA